MKLFELHSQYVGELSDVIIDILYTASAEGQDNLSTTDLIDDLKSQGYFVNVKDLIDIPDNVKNAIEIVPVRWIDKVLELALERKAEPLPDPSPEELAKKAAEASKQTSSPTSGDVIKH